MAEGWVRPAHGILLTQDPIGVAGGVNLYAYAGNNPITFSDPYGLSPDGGVLEIGVGGAAVLLGLATAVYTYVECSPIGRDTPDAVI